MRDAKIALDSVPWISHECQKAQCFTMSGRVSGNSGVSEQVSGTFREIIKQSDKSEKQVFEIMF